jgi:hypothetical protein
VKRYDKGKGKGGKCDKQNAREMKDQRERESKKLKYLQTGTQIYKNDTWKGRF